ncbi:heme biosynthesis operon protein HemX [Vibrio navarrensis]|uniref:Uroporphyrin-III methyltransferase n=1 Tax=Vibrio navarrensis TaxID=29495 RepID=A0A099LNR1_9VIBR|nr:uroporphyrinogen-III C-methyltransferase [Vibrio navarrensis]KGK09843.1 uroporphyrin-III methyltransferase [Vibrio navarrensis]KGK16643.1 uroporphyrin-III methyltransferase [Vibrio navarrensis]MBE4586227.1 heme biosynthesis operon protein HemX [Vibrio navarrensis]MBE4607548.1 heme biosynthesis operon protein HemX [Vibrio navarrensis]MBE4612440.1 heme biosynthesis operon protein HemX [Vibrio navarrensis]
MTSKKNNEQTTPEEMTSTPTSNDISPNNDTSASAEIANDVRPASSDTEKAPHSNTQPEQKRGSKLSIIAIVIALLGTGGLAYQMQQQSSHYQAQIAALQNQLQQTQSSLTQQMNQVKADTAQQASSTLHKAEVELAQQQKSIESLQLAMADVKGRRPNDWLLAEADYLVKLAGRKLFLEHDATSATHLMESADQRIATLNDPSFVPLRKAMASDITKLKTIPIIDRDGLVMRLTALQQQVDQLPLANAILPEAKAVEKTEVSEDISNWQDNLLTSLKDFSENFITFRTRDGNVIPLLSPEQHFYLKENIKAKLETAIKAVYLEQNELYTIALTTAESWSESFFNLDDNAVKEFNRSLKQLSQQNVQVAYPMKLETQNQLADVIRERLRRDVTTLTSTEDKQ